MKTQRAVSFDESSMESAVTLHEEARIGCGTSDGGGGGGGDGDGAGSCGGGGGGGGGGGAATRVSCESCRGIRESSQAEEVGSLEEARSVIASLRARQRAQAHQMLAWRRTLKLQEELVARLTREKAEQLRSLSSQLLLFESRLCRKQKEIEASLAQREAIILRQQRVIRQLQNKLRLQTGDHHHHHHHHHHHRHSSGHHRHQTKSTGCEESDCCAPCVPAGGATTTSTGGSARDSPPCDSLDRLDSLGDSDSAVVLEEAFLDDPAPLRFRSNITDVTVIRSVSDAFEPSSKYGPSARRGNGLLRRPEVLETVYSVEEDGDGDRAESEEVVEADEEDNIDEPAEDGGGGRAPAPTTTFAGSAHQHSPANKEAAGKPRLRDLYGSFERLAQQEAEMMHEGTATATTTTTTTGRRSAGNNALGGQRSRDDSQQAQVTYNRVMSNHRSVTKPKDVKYKRINKAKSKSLEELRGRLRNWVEKGNKIAISLDQSYA